MRCTVDRDGFLLYHWDTALRTRGEMTMSAENVMGMPTNHVDMGADELGYDGGSLSIATILTIVGVTIVARFAVKK